jgi:hypothetical protein
MFASATGSALAQRTLGALRLTRSFLMLEDDYDVDWEVDLDEPLAQKTHPHRAWLRGPGSRSRRLAARRGGQQAPAWQHCLSPVGQPASGRAQARGRASAAQSCSARAAETREAR